MQPITKLVAIKGNKFENEFPELSLSFLNNVIEKCEKLENFYVEDYKIPRQKVINFDLSCLQKFIQDDKYRFCYRYKS